MRALLFAVKVFIAAIYYTLSLIAAVAVGGVLMMALRHVTTFDSSNYGRDWTNTFLFGGAIGLLLWAFVVYALLAGPPASNRRVD